ncbi:MAG: ATP-binding protein [Lachnospiraceae bacterium]|nr:ATP-binding protein [Lachnospiraceae bacterium]
MFIGRESELQFLEDRYNRTDGQLIVLYGRRRIGKTETLRKFCEGKSHVFYSCKECDDRLQLKSFSEKILKENLPAGKYITEFSDWEKALASVTELPYNGKKLLIIDEFPYMCKGNQGIPSILQALWDEVLKNSNVMIILCGSSMSFIEKELLSEKNPLYGRATGIYRMREMSFKEASLFFPDYSPKDKILAYAILGGIPHYLNQFNPSVSLEDNIKQNILAKGCILYSEVEFLLKQELRETALYNSLIEAVALGSTKLNEISQKSLMEDTSKTSVYLRNLIELGIIEREFSVNAGTKEKANTNRGLYRLTDNYFRFWYAFVFPNHTELELNDVEGIYQYAIAPKLHEFASLTFEDVCREYLRNLQKEGRLPFRFTRMGRWFGKTTVRDADSVKVAETEIDIVAVSESPKSLLIGECKFKGHPFTYSDFLDTFAKLTPQKADNKFYYALFSESGFDEKVIQTAQAEKNIYLFSLDDIVN